MIQVQSRLLSSSISGDASKWIRTTSKWKGTYTGTYMERFLELCAPNFKDFLFQVVGFG